MSDEQNHVLSEQFDATALTSMGEVRESIDVLDQALIALLTRRLSCIVAASRLKTSPNEARVAWRVADVISKVRQGAADVGFDPDLAQEIWQEMMERCIAFEHHVLSEK
jgi:isochorismate pyruvate lyase